MRRAAWIAAALMMVMAAPATAATVDATSAHTGLRAYRAFASSLLRESGTARRNGDAFVAAVKAKCPNVLESVSMSDTFVQGAATQFGKEAGADLLLSAFVSFRKPLATLNLRLSRLSWSTPQIGAGLQRGLDAEQRAFALMTSDLCADASALAANGGRKLPPGAQSFLSNFQHELATTARLDVKAMLLRHRSARDRRLVREVNRLEDRASTRLGNALTAEVPKLLDALGLFV